MDNNDDIITGLWICSDCAMFHANGEVPDTWGEDDIPEGHWAVLDDVDTFSWSCCDSCGTALGGARHEAAIVA